MPPRALLNIFRCALHVYKVVLLWKSEQAGTVLTKRHTQGRGIRVGGLSRRHGEHGRGGLRFRGAVSGDAQWNTITRYFRGLRILFTGYGFRETIAESF